MTPRVTASMDPEAWPRFMTSHEVAIVMGRSGKAILNACGTGRVWPPPVADTHGFIKPYRWDRALVLGVMTGTIARPRRLVHPRRRPSKAA